MTELSATGMHFQQATTAISVEARVMNVLKEIRATRADSSSYDETAVLTDVGFTSLEMVKVMLGVEAAFDIMIPAADITPANFANAAAISALVDRVLASA